MTAATAKEVLAMNYSIATLDPEADTEPESGDDKVPGDDND